MNLFNGDHKTTRHKVRLFGTGFLAGALTIALVAFGLVQYGKHQSEIEESLNEPSVDVTVVLGAIQEISELATVQQTYTVVQRVEDTNGLPIFDSLTLNWFILKYSGTIKAGVDLSQVTVTLNGKQVEVHLPEAEILSDELDTSSFETLAEKGNFLNPFHIENVTDYLDETQHEAEIASIEAGLLEEANHNAEIAVAALVKPMLPEGYELVFV